MFFPAFRTEKYIKHTWSVQVCLQMWHWWWPTLPPSLCGTQPSEGSQSVLGRCWHRSHSDKRRSDVSYTHKHFFRHDTLTLCKTVFTWIWARFPAVMLDTVQHASFLMDSLGLLSRCSKHGRAEQFKITWDDSSIRGQCLYFTLHVLLYIHMNEKSTCVHYIYTPVSECHLLSQCCPLHVKQEKPPCNHCAWKKHPHKHSHNILCKFWFILAVFYFTEQHGRHQNY